MHVLTKIFIVLVSILALMMVPLVVVYAHNENSFKSRFNEAEAKTNTALESMKAAEARAGAEQSRLQLMIDDLRAQNTKLQNEKTAADVTVNQLTSQLAAAQSTQAGIVGDITQIRTAVEAGQQLTQSLVEEIRELRANAVAIERQRVELDEELADTRSQLEVAEQARRALQEELARIKDDHAKALTQLSAYVAKHGDLDIRAGALKDRAIRPDINLTATVIRVERSSGQVLAEIDAGSRDGVKENWSMTIGNGGEFIANLRIINVDINRSTGIVTLENKERGFVQVGFTAHSVAGQD